MISKNDDKSEAKKDLYDVIIVGGGAAGTACSALLSKWGLNVLLIEQRGHLGGRASTLEPLKGFKFDTGVHGIPYYDLGSLKKIEKELEIKFDLIDYKPLLAFYDAEEEISIEVTNFKKEGFKEVNRIWSPEGEFFRLLDYLNNATEDDAEKLDNVTVKDFIQKFSPTHQFYQLLRGINGMITIEPHLGSAGEFVRSFSKLFSSNRPITYPKKAGIQSLSDTLGRICEDNGGKVLTSHTVKEIITNDRNVVGVKISYKNEDGNYLEKEIMSNAIIVTTPLQFLFKIINKEFFSLSFIEKIENLKDKQSCAQGIAFAFKDELLNDFPWNPKCWGAIVFQPGKKPRYLSVPSALVKDITPPGIQYMFYGIVVTPEEIKDKKLNNARINELKKEMYSIFPRLRKLKTWVFKGTSEIVLGTAKRVSMTGKFKPANKSEIEGLFFAGDTASGEGPGLECTYDSALKCSRIVFDWINEEKKLKKTRRLNVVKYN
ncbi:MAG: phytoene desaturase family protein [Candidatus Helarchaeota archaeon]